MLPQLCQNLTSEDVAKTFKTNKQMDKNAAKLEGERNGEIIYLFITIRKPCIFVQAALKLEYSIQYARPRN